MTSWYEIKKISDVFIQTGYSTYEPKHCEWAKSIDFLEFQQRLDEADIVIAHGGAGCIADALERNKPIVVVPRLAKYDEHNNDHQLELSGVLEESGRILVAYEIEDLLPLLEKAKQFTPAQPTGSNQIANLIRDHISAYANRRNLAF